MRPLLAVRDLRAGYGGIPVVFHLDLEVGEREIVALLGANGAGKTTTLRALSGMIPPMAGTVTLDGVLVSGRPAQRLARLGIVHVPEGRGIFPTLEVDESLRLAAAMAGVPRRAVTEAVDEVYATFPRLAARRGQSARTLSGGEQQMLALARGLVHRPRLLMIDEMSQGLAPTVVDALFALMAELPARGVSLLVVEQFVSRALRLASRAYVLEKGEVSYAGSAAALADDEAFVRGSYLGAANTPPRAGVPPPGERTASSGRQVRGVTG
jgi:branched-chain amino acid transport system ATP-binding protein